MKSSVNGRFEQPIVYDKRSLYTGEYDFINSTFGRCTSIEPGLEVMSCRSKVNFEVGGSRPEVKISRPEVIVRWN